MENILYNVSQVLGITLIHSLWQGLLVYCVLRVLLALAAGIASEKKYLIALTALTVITGSEERAAQQKYHAELQAYRNSPEIIKEKQLMDESSNKARDYMRSAEFKQHVRQWKNQLHTIIGNDYDSIVHPDSLAVK